MKLGLFSAAAAVALFAVTGAASADVTYGPTFVSACGCDIEVITAGTSLSLPTYTPPVISSLPFSLVNLGTGSTGGYQNSNTINPPFVGINSISFSTPSGPTGLYSGNTPNTALSPFGGDSTTDNNNPNNDYLVAEPGGTVTINYTNSQTSLDLLWGTVDEAGGQNQVLTLTAGSNTITGAEIASLIPSSLYTDGADDVGVVITGLSAFSEVQATDGSGNNPAFEFVPGVAPAPSIGCGLPALLAVGGMLFGVKLWGRGRKRFLFAAPPHAAA
jgi:hypothetical protein